MRYLCEVVEAGSASAAAARLHVAPTAISMQLAQLESQLGGVEPPPSPHPAITIAASAMRAHAMETSARMIRCPMTDDLNPPPPGSGTVNLGVNTPREALFEKDLAVLEEVVSTLAGIKELAAYEQLQSVMRRERLHSL